MPAPDYHPSLYDHTAIGLMSNVLLTPFRAYLNGAAQTANPYQTFQTVTPRLFKGALANIARGTLAITMQTSSKSQLEHYLGKENPQAKFWGDMSAVLTGAFVGSTLETYYIRKQAGIIGMRFSLPLTGVILARECGFIANVFSDQYQLSSTQTYALNFGTTAFTAGCHRLIVPLAKAAKTESFFSFKCAPDPLQVKGSRLANACNILFFRFAYLEACRHIMKFNREEVWPKIKG